MKLIHFLFDPVFMWGSPTILGCHSHKKYLIEPSCHCCLWYHYHDYSHFHCQYWDSLSWMVHHQCLQLQLKIDPLMCIVHAVIVTRNLNHVSYLMVENCEKTNLGTSAGVNIDVDVGDDDL